METYPNVYRYRRMVQSKLYIDAHFTENIELDAIADEAYFSKFHFVRLFKSAFGKTPHQYRTTLRIEKAKELLTAGQTVTETCFSIGFDSLTTFAGLFRRSVGQTPSAFREQARTRAMETRSRPLQFVPHCFARNVSIKKSNFEEVV